MAFPLPYPSRREYDLFQHMTVLRPILPDPCTSHSSHPHARPHASCLRPARCRWVLSSWTIMKSRTLHLTHICLLPPRFATERAQSRREAFHAYTISSCKGRYSPPCAFPFMCTQLVMLKRNPVSSSGLTTSSPSSPSTTIVRRADGRGWRVAQDWLTPTLSPSARLAIRT
jgi:hypothetical protein